MSSSLLVTALSGAALLGQASAALAGLELAAFATDTCDYGSGQYTYFGIGSGYPSCTENYFAGTGFPQVGTDFKATFDFPDPGTNENGEACKIFVRAPSNVDNPGCGEVQTQVVKAACVQVTIPDPFDLNFCCGTDCTAALQNSKRDVLVVNGTDTYTIKAKREPEPEPEPVALPEVKQITGVVKEVRDIAAPKRNSLLRETVVLTKRDGIWNGSPVETQDGPAQQVSQTMNCQAEGQNSATFEVSTSSTQTFSVTTEVGASLFEIISASISVSYSYAYTEEHSASTTSTYTCSEGTSGYISWAPTLACTTGSFSDGCTASDGSNCPTGEQTACAPVVNQAGLPLGTTNFVTIV